MQTLLWSAIKSIFTTLVKLLEEQRMVASGDNPLLMTLHLLQHYERCCSAEVVTVSKATKSAIYAAQHEEADKSKGRALLAAVQNNPESAYRANKCPKILALQTLQQAQRDSHRTFCTVRKFLCLELLLFSGGSRGDAIRNIKAQVTRTYDEKG